MQRTDARTTSVRRQFDGMCRWDIEIFPRCHVEHSISMHHVHFFLFEIFRGGGGERAVSGPGTSLCDLYFYDHPSVSRFLFLIGGKNDYERPPSPPPPTHTPSISLSHIHTHTTFHIYHIIYNVRLNEIQPRVQNEKNHLFCLRNNKNVHF